jgi:anaerobic magnesium-protoporphyrin IX monomethyl ester cyclase
MTSRGAKGRRPILIAHSYFLRYDEKQLRRMKPYAPLATLLSAAVLRCRGHSIRFFDAMLSAGVEEFEAALDETRPTLVGILEDNFNFITKMCTLRMRRAALDMITAAKARGCRVAVNGSDASDRPELYLGAGADAVIAGEPELTFAELADLWTRDPSAPPDGIAGLILPAAPSRDPGAGNGVTAAAGVRYTAPRPALKDLDALPVPAWDLVDAEAYRAAWLRAHGHLSWIMATSRGCPYGCNWCAKPVFGRRYAQRSPGSVVEELARLRESVAPDHIWFADDIFGLTTAWIEAFAAEVTRRDVRTPFTIQSRVNLMTPATVAALAAAGAAEVWLGVESGSQRILDAMEKGSTVEQARRATRLLKAHGIRTGWFMQLGYLGETWEDILRTRELIREERPDEIGVSVSYPLPGTRFYEMVREQIGPKQNWEHTGDLDMMFHGTYTTAFYRRIRDLLHDEVDALRAGADLAPLDCRWAELEVSREEYRNGGVARG